MDRGEQGSGMTSEAHDARAQALLPDAGLLARGLAGLRIFFGLILFANGVAKLLEFRTIETGPWKTFLINRDGARHVLAFETNKRGGDGSDVPLRKSVVNHVMLPNWDVFRNE